MPHRIARTVFFLYLLLAIVLLFVGALVLFAPHEMKPDPQSALPVLFAGFPWSFGMLALITGKEPALAIFAALGLIPLGLNVLLLWLLQRWTGRKRMA